jgi:predicted DNA binding CopG/RHH family protein
MPSIIKIPTFANESEEAAWWFANCHLVEEDLQSAMTEGRTGRGNLMRKALAADTAIELDAEDLSKAQAVAARKGMPYQTYLKQLIHDALEKESAV